MTAEKMKECVWLRLEAVAQIEFLQWTDSDRLRHSKFVGLREDVDPHRHHDGHIHALAARSETKGCGTV